MQLDSVFQSWFKSNEPGGAVLIVKEGKIIYQKAWGVADIITREPVTTKTLFNPGSISKTFVAYGILKLASLHKLSPDDNLYQYFPDFNNRGIGKLFHLFFLLNRYSSKVMMIRVSDPYTT